VVDKELIENRLLKLEQILRKLHTLSADTMKKIAGFRKILVHDYLKIDNRIVYKALKNLGGFKKFAETIAILLQQPGT
jgi:uncharacterized protein YutE (UPF0331/DUF86 family)